MFHFTDGEASHSPRAKNTSSVRCLFLYSVLSLIFFNISATAADYGGTFTGAYKDEPSTLNPLVEISSVSTAINQVIFDGLVTITLSGKVLPRLAERWKVSDDGLTWTFYIRRNIHFHDGTKMTSRDVVFTYKTALSSPSLLSRKILIKNIKTIDALDEYTVRFRLDSPGSNFLTFLYIVGVVPSHILDGNPYKNEKFNKNPIGTGPFRLTSWSPRKEIILEANKNYFEGRPYMDRVKLLYVPEMFEMWRKLHIGEIDGFYNEILPVDYESLENNKRLNNYRQKDYMNYVLLFNFGKREFKDKRLRYAINAAIDRQEIIEKALLENGIECTGMFSEKTIGSNEYNPRKSLEMLEEMGYRDTDGDGIVEKDGKKLSFRMLFDTGNLLKAKVIVVLQKQLLEVGIELVGEDAPIPEIFMKALSKNYDMIFTNYCTWLDTPVLVWHTESITSGHNLSHYSNKKVDSLLNQLTETTDDKKRLELKRKIDKEITNDIAGVFLFTKYNLISLNKRIHGFDPDADVFFWELFNRVYIPKELQKKQ